MANETKEIGDIVKKCKILLLDIEGTTTSISFVKDKLFPYAEENVKKFLESEWEKEDVKEVVVALRKLAVEDQDNKVDGAVEIPGEDASKDDQISGLVSSVKWQMSADRKAGPLKQLQGLIWKQGYDNGEIKGHVYDDVAGALEQWRSIEGQKVYIYSSGSVQAQKLLFGQSLAGDLLPQIDGHFDTAVGAKQEAASYTAIVEKVDAKPDEILFLTDIAKEAEAARAAGMHAALVSREGNAPLPEDAAASFPVLHSLALLVASNKRKPDQVEEETPAKVPKTDAEKDVKATAETVATAPTEETKEEEKMEVETETTTPETPPEPEKETVKVVTAIEEITDSNEAVDAPMIDIEPIVEEENKTEEKETEKEEVKTSNDESDSKPTDEVHVNNVSENPTDATDKPVIEEVTNDKSPTADVDVADITEELVPVVEEPPAAEDMEVLQNVGEVLVNECDDILSKVQDVTNLDSIPVKPLLNPIAEETMETENLDSNDIVDRILDSELELEMKQKEIMNSASVGEDNKTKEENGVAEETNAQETNGVDIETTDVDVESSKKVEDNSSEEVSAESKPEETVAMETQVEEKQDTPVTESKESQVESVKSAEEQSRESPVEEKKPDADSKPVTESPTESPFEASKPAEEKPAADSSPVTEVKEVEENKTEEKVTEVTKPEENSSEPQVNGKATNGDSEANMNGDSKEEEICSRLSVENGKESSVNGSNGDSMDAEQGQGDNKMEEIADIKAKTVAAVDPPAEPIDQPTEA